MPNFSIIASASANTPPPGQTPSTSAAPCRRAGRSGSPRAECAVLALQLLSRPSPAVFGPDGLLLATTTGGLTVLNTRTWLPVLSAPHAGQSAVTTDTGAL